MKASIVIIAFCLPFFSTVYAQNNRQLQHLGNVLEQRKAEAEAKNKKDREANITKVVNEAVRTNKSKITQDRLSESNPDVYILTIDGTNYSFANLSDRDRAKDRFIANTTNDAIASLRRIYPKTTNNDEATIRQKISSRYSVQKGRNPNPNANQYYSNNDWFAVPKNNGADDPSNPLFDVNTQYDNILEAPSARNRAPSETTTQPSVSLNFDYIMNNGETMYIGKSQTPIEKNPYELTINMQIQEQPHAPEMPNTIIREYEKQQLLAEQKKEKYELEKAKRFNVDSLKSQKEALEAKLKDFKCPEYDQYDRIACERQRQQINDEINVIENRMNGRDEWLKEVENMKNLGTLAQESQKYQTLAEMAGLAEYSYKEKEGLPDGWKPVYDSKLSAIISEENDNMSGFHCELLQNEEGKYVLSFRGTELAFNDIVGADLLEALCPVWQTNNAIKIVERLTNAGIELDNITVTGHSLGGRLAAEVAIAKGLTAYTFNAADISITTKATITTTGFIDPRTNIINTVSANDLLTGSVGLGSYFGGNISNTNIMKEAYGNSLAEGHSITFLRQALEQRYQDTKR